MTKRADIDKAFRHGMVVAATLVAKTHDKPDIAKEILIAAGVRTIADIKTCGAGDFDVKALIAVVRDISR